MRRRLGYNLIMGFPTVLSWYSLFLPFSFPVLPRASRFSKQHNSITPTFIEVLNTLNTKESDIITCISCNSTCRKKWGSKVSPQCQSKQIKCGSFYLASVKNETIFIFTSRSPACRWKRESKTSPVFHCCMDWICFFHGPFLISFNFITYGLVDHSYLELMFLYQNISAYSFYTVGIYYKSHVEESEIPCSIQDSSP